MVKNIDKVTGEANEVFQLMAFVYLNHKKNLKIEKLQDLGVACFRVWFGHFLVKSWFFDYIITMSIQKWTFSSCMNLIMMIKCRTIRKFENFLHFREENIHRDRFRSTVPEKELTRPTQKRFLLTFTFNE